MEKNKLALFCIEAEKIRSDIKFKEAIQKQNNLSLIANEKAEKRYLIEDKLIEIYHSILLDGFDNDDILVGNNLSEHERINHIAKLWMMDDPKIERIKKAIEKSGKKEEIEKLESEKEKAIFEYFDAQIKLDTSISEAHETLFSDEYKKKLDEYSKSGILLYYLETPDLPILCKDISKEDVLDSFVLNDYYYIRILFQNFISHINSSPSMRRKSEDLISTIDSLSRRQYRTAARNAFALLESEHKNCSSAMDNYFSLNKGFRKGKERAEKIQQLLDSLKKQTYISKVWNIINPIYKDILDSKKNSFIDRNSIIHGDYNSELLDINNYDVIKLMLLFLNMRMISDQVQIYCEMFRECINYSEIFLFQKQKQLLQSKNKKKQW